MFKHLYQRHKKGSSWAPTKCTEPEQVGLQASGCSGNTCYSIISSYVMQAKVTILPQVSNALADEQSLKGALSPYLDKV